MTIKVGVHVSILGSIDRSVDRAKALDCTAFQIFTRNPRGWKFGPLKADEVEEFRKKVKRYGYDSPISHMPYLPNLASPDPELYKLSVETLTSEVDRCGQLGIPYLVIHLGSHMGKGIEPGLRRVSDACRHALKKMDNDVMILLENMAGTRNSVGSSFEDIGRIMEAIQDETRIGLCFDTCHAFAAGYDLRTREAVERTLRLFDDALGFRNLKTVHLNDSFGVLNSAIDRHEHIGIGHIGEPGFESLLHRKEIRHLPLILETPVDERRDDIGNLRKVRALAR